MEQTNDSADEKEDKPLVARNAIGLQRMKLEKLMKNPDKPVIIPERQKDKKLPHVPDFVRNVMGSSAGAGSGEFHVYRHLRRKEYARQKIIHEKSEKTILDEEYQQKLENNKRAAEERTAKKRAKRLKNKQKLKKKMKEPTTKKDSKNNEEISNSDSSMSSDESDNGKSHKEEPPDSKSNRMEED